jgi:sugar (pentulose or hexulose) kinase
MLEAIALTMKNHMNAMCRDLRIELDQIIVSGGGARSGLFMQIFSDVFGIPAIRNEIMDAAGLGSAICVAVAVNAYDTFGAAIEKMVRIRDFFHPIPEHTSLYDKMNQEVYRHITGFTDSILEKSYPIFKQ